ncbi:MAG: TnpV protein [Lachnospiraceae bacterium]|nr:TnpV protein [Lachnospiraceae bacterium]
MSQLAIKYHEAADGMMYPNIQTEREELTELTKYGMMALDYLKASHPVRYRQITRFGMVMETLQPVQEEAWELHDMTVKAYLEKHKPENPDSTMEMWKIREQAERVAEEMVLAEIVNRYH